MGEFIGLKKDENKEKYKFGVINVPIERLIGKRQELDIKYHTAIVVKNLDLGVDYIHTPLTTYIYENFQNVSPNHVKNNASTIANFMNYLYFNKDEELRVSNLKDLSMRDVSEYLNQKALILQESSRKQYEIRIKNFIYYFGMKGLLKNFPKENIENRVILKNIEDGLQQTNDLLHDMEASLIMLFIDVAMEVAPRIAFGVYLECFGGLRLSEVTNLVYSAIEPIGHNCSDGCILDIKKRIMRPDLPGYDARSRVKKVRSQVVFPCGGKQEKLYEFHKKNFKSKTSVDAVFVDESGMPMTHKAYRDYFNKAKSKFIEVVAEFAKDVGTLPFLTRADALSRQRWSTHLFRGFFSNMCAAHVKTVNELMVLRGDSNPKSSIPYLQTSTTTKKAIDKAITKTYEDLCSSIQFKTITKVYKFDARIKMAEKEIKKLEELNKQNRK